VRAANLWLAQYFDPASAPVEAAVSELVALEVTKIEPPLPPVGEARRLLQGVIRGSTSAP